MKQYNVQATSVSQLYSQIRLDFHDYPLQRRSKFRLVREYVTWLQEGTKCTTVRYRPSAIDVPTAFRLPLVESSYSDSDDVRHIVNNGQVGFVEITSLVIKPFAMLDDQDASRDGFSAEGELKQALQWLYSPNYGTILDDQYVTIYSISLVQHD